MHDELYADGIGEITVTGTIVRIDIVSLSPSERDANNNPKTVFRQRIVMPVDAFANSVDLMQKVLSGLVEANVVQQRPAPPRADDKWSPEERHLPGTAQLEVPVSKNASPNFS